MYSKFFDNKGALPHHVHHRDQHAKLVGMNGQAGVVLLPGPEQQLRRGLPVHLLRPAPGHDEGPGARVPAELHQGRQQDHRTSPPPTAWSRAPAGTFPPGILHAPGSLCTYEPQKASDVFAMYQSLTGDAIIPEELLWKNTPPEKVGNVDYLIEVLDWEANVDPELRGQSLHAPEAGAAGRPDGGGGLRGELDHLQVPRVQRQGAHRAAREDRHHQGRRRLRHDPAAGAREDGRLGHRLPRPSSASASSRWTSSSSPRRRRGRAW